MLPDTVVLHPATYLLVKLLTLFLVAAIYWLITAHSADQHQPGH